MACHNCNKRNVREQGFAMGGGTVKPQEVKITGVRSSPFILPGNVSGTQSTYTYMVGVLGPFTLTLAGADDTPEKVNQAMQQKVNDLKTIGAIQ